MKIVEVIDVPLTEANLYTLDRWDRWWCNEKTGQTIEADEFGDHDAYLEDHLEQFLTPSELTRLTDGRWQEDDGYGYGYIREQYFDNILEYLYEKGWCATLFDGNTGELALRTATEEGAKKIARQFNKSHYINRLALDVNGNSMVLEGQPLRNFLR